MHNLKNSYRTYESMANELGEDWKKESKTSLVLKASDDTNPLRENYLSALICKYWGTITINFKKSLGSGVTPLTCYDWMIDGILKGMSYRKWEDPTCSLYGDPDAPEKIINRCIYSARQLWYYNSNLIKNSGDSSLIKLDALLNDQEENYEFIQDDTESSLQQLEKVDHLKNFIQSYIDKEKVEKAIVIDNICFGDVILNKKYSKTKLVDVMEKLSLDEVYKKHFISNYNITEEDYEQTVERISSLNRTKLLDIVKNLIQELYHNMDAREICGKL